MIGRLLLFICKFLPFRIIEREPGDKYLTRYKLLGFMPNKPSRLPFSLYIHHFHRPDADGAPHNHPWKWACSLILSGGYWEFRKKAGCDAAVSWKGPFHFNWIPHGVYHLVSDTRFRETWTLFLAGPRVSSWGFLDSERGHIEWRDYLREQNLKPEY
jgi:hypothetical protein